jgi:hypothetical protein
MEDWRWVSLEMVVPTMFGNEGNYDWLHRY